MVKRTCKHSIYRLLLCALEAWISYFHKMNFPKKAAAGDTLPRLLFSVFSAALLLCSSVIPFFLLLCCSAVLLFHLFAALLLYSSAFSLLFISLS